MTAAPSLTPNPATQTVRRLRLGFAGAGWIGRNRLEAIAGSGLGEIAAIMDPVREAAQSAAAGLGNVHCGASFEELLEMDLDGIVIATPSALHAAQSIAALESGKAVFCQKPLARTGPETAAVIAAARRADRLLGVDLSYRHTSGMQRIRDLISNDELGEIYAVNAVFHNAYGPDKAWFYNVKEAGGGCLLDLGIHLIDLTLWCLDFPAVTSARGSLKNQAGVMFSPGDGVEDYAAGLLELDTGAVVQLACSWRSPAGCDARIELTFLGTRGGAEFRNVNGSFYDFTAEHFPPDRSRRTLASPPEEWGGRAAVDWARRLGQSPAFDPDIANLTSVAETLDRLYGRGDAYEL